jgi:hypothetical protein
MQSQKINRGTGFESPWGRHFAEGSTTYKGWPIYPPDDTIGAASEYERSTTVKAINDGLMFVTIVSSGGNWHKGQPVYIIKVNGTEYIKTLYNGKEQDNENLPEF